MEYNPFRLTFSAHRPSQDDFPLLFLCRPTKNDMYRADEPSYRPSRLCIDYPSLLVHKKLYFRLFCPCSVCKKKSDIKQRAVAPGENVIDKITLYWVSVRLSLCSSVPGFSLATVVLL